MGRPGGHRSQTGGRALQRNPVLYWSSLQTLWPPLSDMKRQETLLLNHAAATLPLRRAGGAAAGPAFQRPPGPDQPRCGAGSSNNTLYIQSSTHQARLSLGRLIKRVARRLHPQQRLSPTNQQLQQIACGAG